MKNSIPQFAFLFLFFFSVNIVNAQVRQLWGTTTSGGTYGYGTILKSDSAGTNFHSVYSFNQTNGSYPCGKMTLADNGYLYGITINGGNSNGGIIYKFDTASNTLTKIRSFLPTVNQGAIPYSGMIKAANGKLYGMTNQGGTNSGGVIFVFDPSTNSYIDIYNFSSATGTGPFGELLQLSDGKFYGMTSSGGANGGGVIFRYDDYNQIYTVLYNFSLMTGSYPAYCNLIQASNGKLYSTTDRGGLYGYGVIFSYDLTTGVYSDLHDFNYGTDGIHPFGSLVQAPNGKLYGMTISGGSTTTDGNVFSYDIATGTYTQVLNFTSANGSGPKRGFTKLSNGKLIGATFNGGLNNYGKIFSLDPATDTYTSLMDLDSTSAGAHPDCEILEAPVCLPASLTISANPAGAICAGTSVTFTAAPVNGGSNPSYQWKKNNVNVATGSSYTTSSLANNDNVVCVMTLTNGCLAGSPATSNAITMSVTPNVVAGVNIAASPNGPICVGTSVTFTATPVNGGNAPSYQWKKNSVNVGTGTTYTTSSLANGDNIVCQMTSNASCVTGNPATSSAIIMSVDPGPPAAAGVSITVSPGTNICSGNLVTFTPTPVNGGSNPAYQWKKNNVNVGTGTSYISSSLANNDTITCIMTSNWPCATGNPASSNAVVMTVTSANTNASIISNSIARGTQHSIYLCDDGTVKTVGANFQGQLGIGVTGSSVWTPVQVPGLTNVVAVSAGASHSLVLKADGTVWSWGYDAEGQLGTGPPTTSGCFCDSVPKQVVGLTNIIAIEAAVNGYFSMALRADGTVWTWGDNFFGELGDGTSNNTRNTPVQAYGLNNIVAIAGGSGHSLALKSDGTVWTFGSNNFGQLGIGNSNSVSFPIQVSSISNVIAIAGGGRHSLAVKSDRTVWAWGENVYGELGDSTTVQRNTPVQTHGISNVIAVKGGGQSGYPSYHGFSLALTATGDVWGWGGNDHGQLCDSTVIDRIVPVQAHGLSNVAAISGGRDSTLFLLSDGTVKYPGTAHMPVTRPNLCPVQHPPAVARVIISGNPGPGICTGTAVTFTAIPINGGTSPSYQWKKNGVNVATGSTYTTSALVNNDSIVCVLTSNASCISSNPTVSNSIIMNVSSNQLAASVSISVNPTGAVCSGTPLTFTATPTNGGPAPAYVWKRNNVVVWTGATYSYSPTSSDSIVCLMTSNAPCLVSNPVISNTIHLTVNPTYANVGISASPSGTICSGTMVTFTASSFNGGPSPIYQWQKNSVNVGTGITYTSNTLVNGDTIKCILTSSAPCVTTPATSNLKIMSVTPTVVAGVSIAANPSGTICTGTSVTFTATPVNGGSSPTYQWKKNNVAVGTGTTYTSSSLANSDTIVCVMTSNAACVTGNPATSGSVIMAVTPPVGAAGPIAGFNSICADIDAPVYYSTSGAINATSYQWTLPYGWAILQGQGTYQIQIVTSAVAVSGNVTVVPMNGSCTGASYSYYVNVMPVPLNSGSTVGGGSYCAGGNGVPIGVSSAVQGVFYQLKYNNAYIGSPITNPNPVPATIWFPNQTVAGQYTVNAYYATGCNIDFPITAFVSIDPTPSLTTSATAANCAVSNGSATVTATGGTTPYTYAWNTTPVQTTATATGLIAGNYIVTVTGANGCSVTATATVASLSTLSANASATNVSCYGGNNGTASVAASGGSSPYTYQWNPAGGNGATASGLSAGSHT